MESFSIWMDAYNHAVNGAMAFVTNESRALWGGLMTLAGILLGSRIMFQAGPPMSSTVFMIVRGALFLMAVQGAVPLGEFFIKGFTELGLLAGGSGQNADTFLGQPDSITLIGYTKMVDLFELSNQACKVGGWLRCLGNLQGYLPPSAAAYVIYACFWLIAFSVWGCVILFKVAWLLAVIILPLAVFSPFEELGRQPLIFAFRTGVQLAVLAIVVGVGSNVFTDLVVGITPGFDATYSVLTGSLIFAGVTVSTMIIAHSLTGKALLAGDRIFTAPASTAVDYGRTGAAHVSSGGVGAVASGVSSAGSYVAGGARAAASAVQNQGGVLAATAGRAAPPPAAGMPPMSSRAAPRIGY